MKRRYSIADSIVDVNENRKRFEQDTDLDEPLIHYTKATGHTNMRRRYGRKRYTRKRRGITRKRTRRTTGYRRSIDRKLLAPKTAKRLIEIAQDLPLKYIAFSNSGISNYYPFSETLTTAFHCYGREFFAAYCTRLPGGTYTGAAQTRAGDKVHVPSIHGKIKVTIPATTPTSNVRVRYWMIYVKPDSVVSGLSPEQIIQSMYGGVGRPQFHQMYDYLNANTPTTRALKILKTGQMNVVPTLTNDSYDYFWNVGCRFKKPLLFDFSNTAGVNGYIGNLYLIFQSDTDGVECDCEMKVYFRDQA